MLALLALGLSISCSLGNISHDDCTSDGECTQAFGLGSRCSEGFCTERTSCATGHDCRKAFGGGACVKGVCTATLPKDPACPLSEPSDLFDRSGISEDAPDVIGGVFATAEDADNAQITAVQLAIREIKRSGGDATGREMGIVFCDIGGPNDAADGDARRALVEHAMDYLSGTLGVPVVIGPSTSSDSLLVINRVLQRRYATAMISPSATSPALTAIGDRLNASDPVGLFWRTCPSDVLQAQVLAKNVIGVDTTITKVAVVYIQDTYGEGLATAFQQTYGISATKLVPYNVGDDFAAVAQQVGQAAPDAVLVIATYGSDALAILEALAAASLTSVKIFFTDGSKDAAGLLDASAPTAVKTMIMGAQGTAPASDAGPNYTLFQANLMKDFGIDASSFSFLSQSYDAAYVGAYGMVYAAINAQQYDGEKVAEGMARLSSGTKVPVGPNGWPPGKEALTSGDKEIDIAGASGELNFDAATGEAPGPIEIWKVNTTYSGFVTQTVITP